jgi:hypothetical protein
MSRKGLERKRKGGGKVKERLVIAQRIVGKGSGKSGKCRGKMGRQWKREKYSKDGRVKA